MKKIIGVYSAPRQHWVGDGFPVRSLFSYHSHGKTLSPFLLLDRAGPAEFAPTSQPRGVGQHPHGGFETVTIVYQGEVAHRDSTGQGGVIGPGDVQWMTAGAGIVHEEFHSAAYAARGGPFEVMQLWVNLPAADKMTPAHYQPITDAQIPRVALPGDAGLVRVIAGEYAGTRGPARSFTPMNVLDLSLRAGHTLEIAQPEGWSTLLALRSGTARVNGEAELGAANLAALSRQGSGFTLEARSEISLLLMAGEPIDEPVVGYGPFVMNSLQEIERAIDDFNSGRFGGIPSTT